MPHKTILFVNLSSHAHRVANAVVDRVDAGTGKTPQQAQVHGRGSVREGWEAIRRGVPTGIDQDVNRACMDLARGRFVAEIFGLGPAGDDDRQIQRCRIYLRNGQTGAGPHHRPNEVFREGLRKSATGLERRSPDTQVTGKGACLAWRAQLSRQNERARLTSSS